MPAEDYLLTSAVSLRRAGVSTKRQEKIEELERDKDTLLESYANMAPELWRA